MKRVDRRRMDELMKEIGVQMSGECRLRWAAPTVRMGEETTAKRADRLREQGRMKERPTQPLYQ